MAKIDLEKIKNIISDSKLISRSDILHKYRIRNYQLDRILNSKIDEFGLVDNHSSVIRHINEYELLELFKNSKSYSEVIRKCGLDVRTSYISLLKTIKDSRDIDISHFSNAKGVSPLRLNDSDIFIKNSTVGASCAKRHIIQKSLIEYRCSLCNNVGEHNGCKLVLQLDHINGDNKDHRLENLRFLCPNCHSQTDNFTAKNRIKKIKKCIDCGIIINKKSIRCVKCSNVFNAKINGYKFEVSKEELEDLVGKLPMTSIGKRFGVSDNAIRKRCTKLGIDFKKT